MPLSSDLISQFVKITQDKPAKIKESTLYGTVTTQDGANYVVLDGSREITPCNTNVVVHDKDRVLVRLKNHEATIIGNMTVNAGQIKQEIDGKTNIVNVDQVISGYVSTDQLDTAILNVQNTLTSKYITADEIESKYISTTELSGEVAKFGYLEAEKLESEVAKFGYVKTDELDVKVGEFGYLKAGDISAEQADITNLKSKVATINNLMFGSAGGDVIQTSFSNSVIATLGDAWIKSAMIESIDTSKVTIASGDDSLRISGNLIQFKDGDDVKMQLGKDAQDKYSVVLCDENGATLLDKDGIKANAIPNQLIVNDMVSDNAAINGKKLDIDSVISEINNDGSKTISATKISVDAAGNTLDVSLQKLTTLEGNVESQGAQITANTEAISTKVTQQDINKSIDDLKLGNIAELTTKYSEINQTVNSISATVAEHESAIESKAENEFVTDLNNKVSNLELDLNGFRTSVSSTYATKDEASHAQTTADEAVSKTVDHETLIAQLSDSISTLVTDGNGTSLMTQTDDGWTFSTAEIQSLVNDISDTLNSLTREVGDTHSVIDVLQQAVNDLGEIAEYVRITTYEDEPCVEWGEGDSDFKLRITNTRMIFTEGSAVLGYFSNQSFHSKKVVIEEELQQGNFVWKKRANGNLGLTWRGGNS